MSAQLKEQNGTDLIEYGVTDAALATLKDKFSEVPDASTKEGYAGIKAGLKELQPLRRDVEKKRKELKAGALEYGRKVDSEAKRITGAILELETPYKDAKQLEDDKAERIKQEAIEKENARIAVIEQKVTDIKELVNGLLGANLKALKSRLEKANSITVNNVEFEDFVEDAREAMENTKQVLDSAISEREVFEKQQAEQEERQREMEEKQAELDAKQAVIDKQEAEQKQKERDAMIAQEAEERATKAAELAAEKEREAAVNREAELKADADKAKREAAETEQRLKDEAEEKKQRELAEAEAREKNRKHKAAINNDAIDALVEGGMTKTAAKQAVTLIAKRLIPNVVISY